MRRCFTDPHYWKNPALRRSREKINGFFFSDIYPWMWKPQIPLSDKRIRKVQWYYCPIFIVYVILLYHCVISMVSRYLAWDHEVMPHICLGQSHVFILQID